MIGPAPAPHHQQRRSIGQGAVGRKLWWNQYEGNQNPFLQEVAHKPLSKYSARFEKDQHARALREARDSIGSLFSDPEREDLLAAFATGGGTTPSKGGGAAGESRKNATPAARDDMVGSAELMSDEDFLENMEAMARRHQRAAATKQTRVNEALRVYRALRPDAGPFFEEEAMLRMQASANQLGLDHYGVFEKGEEGEGGGNDKSSVPQNALMLKNNSPLLDPFQSYLPTVDTKSYILALFSVTQSLADDLELILSEKVLHICTQAELTKLKADPLRFQKLVELLFGAFRLKKDPHAVDDFLDEHWGERLIHLIGPGTTLNLERRDVAAFLRSHLERVLANQRSKMGGRITSLGQNFQKSRAEFVPEAAFF